MCWNRVNVTLYSGLNYKIEVVLLDTIYIETFCLDTKRDGMVIGRRGYSTEMWLWHDVVYCKSKNL